MKGPGPQQRHLSVPNCAVEWSRALAHNPTVSAGHISGRGGGEGCALQELRALESPWMVVGTHLVPETPDAALGCYPPLLSQCPLLTTSDPGSTELGDDGLRLEGEARVR